jgi:hypothetical protein
MLLSNTEEGKTDSYMVVKFVLPGCRFTLEKRSHLYDATKIQDDTS